MVTQQLGEYFNGKTMESIKSVLRDMFGFKDQDLFMNISESVSYSEGDYPLTPGGSPRVSPRMSPVRININLEGWKL